MVTSFDPIGCFCPREIKTPDLGPDGDRRAASGGSLCEDRAETAGLPRAVLLPAKNESKQK
jgi:hypothetical protein